MKNKIRVLAAILLTLLMCTFMLTACSNKVTEEEIKTALANSDGTLTIDKGSSDNVKAFSYVLSDVNASNLKDKNYTRKAVNTVMTNVYNSTLGQYRASTAFSATLYIVGIFHESEEFNADSFIEEILEIICDGKSRTYKGWSISANINEATDTITIKAVS